ncbi:hypothetical protein DFS34DRAFT_629868 [Phlyctochytrium arcticum]|nr:hypothetical protein DFS34DRAFT_629868 [Phlyctochytrium arcticum]
MTLIKNLMLGAITAAAMVHGVPQQPSSNTLGARQIIDGIVVGANCGNGAGTQPSFFVNKQCFCEQDADKLRACVKKIAPNFPFLPKPPNADRECPSPVDDSEGFSKCIDDQSPKSLPNAEEIAAGCIQSENVKPCGSVNSAGATPKTPSTSKAPTGAAATEVPTAPKLPKDPTGKKANKVKKAQKAKKAKEATFL